MPKGASPKREREYKELEHKFEQEGRYKGREEEVAARIVNKQRAETGEAEGDAQTKAKTPSPTKARTGSGTGHLRRGTARRSKPS